jgi:DNA-binding NarL/FixJ family response regulator
VQARVLIADDHAVFREGLRVLLQAQPDLVVVGEASDGEEAVRKAEQLTPDVIVMDLTMPRCGGIEAINRLRRAQIKARVLVLSMHDDQTYLRAALAAGAAGYVPKRAAAKQLLDAIREVAQHRSFIAVALDDGTLQRVLDEGAARDDAPMNRLTDREQEVLELVAQGYTHAEIAERLQLSIKTVDTYRQRVGQKLGLRTRAELVRFAIETGALSITCSDASSSKRERSGEPAAVAPKGGALTG